MPTRLNQWVRDVICKSLLDRKFDPLEKAYDKTRREFGLRVYEYIYTESERRRLRRLPEGWVPQHFQFTVYFAGQHATLSLLKAQPFPYVYSDHKQRYAADHALTTEWGKLTQAGDKLRDDRANARAQTRAALGSFSTVEKLVEKWPEVKPFIPKDFAPITTALAVRTDVLNTMLGLK